jgi:hypothetical protein
MQSRFALEVAPVSQTANQYGARWMKLTSPGNNTNSTNDQVGSDTKKNAKGCPHLPSHDQSTSNRSRAVLGGKDGHGRGLDTHTNAEQDSRDQELNPILCQSTADRAEQTENSGDKDCAWYLSVHIIQSQSGAVHTTASKVVVKRIRAPTTDESRADVGRRVDQTNEEGVAILCFVSNAELLRE